MSDRSETPLSPVSLVRGAWTPLLEVGRDQVIGQPGAVHSSAWKGRHEESSKLFLMHSDAVTTPRKLFFMILKKINIVLTM